MRLYIIVSLQKFPVSPILDFLSSLDDTVKFYLIGVKVPVQPTIYQADEHEINTDLIDPDAILIIKKLKEAGFQAFLVGGSVRDLLAKIQPKDFDISTSARPEQIKQIFQRSCMLIGRRFRLAHIRFGNRIFEVSTFRAGDNESDLIIQDNIWGTPEQDVLRRDFTMNGLYYDPVNHTVIDYVGGWNDIHNRLLRTIGDPVTRFRQDPVRMIRLLKFQARFGFKTDPLTVTALSRCVHEIIKSSPARILEEILRMLESGAAEPFFRLMTSSGLLDLLFPCLEHFLKGVNADDVYRLLAAADKQNLSSGRKPLDRAVLMSCLLFPILEREVETLFTKKGLSPNFGDVLMTTSSLIKGIVISSFSHFPKKLSSDVGYIMSAQYRFTPVNGRKHQKPRISHHKEFELALRLLKIRADADPSLAETFEWWLSHFRMSEKPHDRRPHHAGPSATHKRTRQEPSHDHAPTE